MSEVRRNTIINLKKNTVVAQDSIADYGDPNPEIYTVPKGDVLSQLAVDFDTTIATLIGMNGLINPDVLYVGQELTEAAPKREAHPHLPAPLKRAKAIILKSDAVSEIALEFPKICYTKNECNDASGFSILKVTDVAGTSSCSNNYF
mmetsp:Transcript_24383/g.51089  ORF Transcript_24383/g.51089 Transcript_24383/m.51089 type:complete len:147 (-) Transcript_24383:230-670(-)